MRLWTKQPVEVWNILQETGEYICDISQSKFCNGKKIVAAYDWMVKQMEERVGPRPKGVIYPVWAWHTQEGKHQAPDLRKGYNWTYSKSVWLEVEIPDSEVLLSEYNDWHNVLNDGFNDNSMNEAEWEAQHEWFDSLPREEREKAKLKSWERIFDVTPFEAPDGWRRNGRFVQATFWVLRLENVKKVRFPAVHKD